MLYSSLCCPGKVHLIHQGITFCKKKKKKCWIIHTFSLGLKHSEYLLLHNIKNEFLLHNNFVWDWVQNLEKSYNSYHLLSTCYGPNSALRDSVRWAWHFLLYRWERLKSVSLGDLLKPHCKKVADLELKTFPWHKYLLSYSTSCRANLTLTSAADESPVDKWADELNFHQEYPQMISQFFLSLQEGQAEGNSLFIKQNLKMFGDTQSCICCYPTTVLSNSHA